MEHVISRDARTVSAFVQIHSPTLAAPGLFGESLSPLKRESLFSHFEVY